ncbi:SDR family NAD(P)-dependent oxidoreductase [Streptomyces sp. SID13726]|uniref:SDR family NAD(P)-dependent oxidoreductase n=1 Tax=Streptomyces sp. SID13726 TaxID=2706058 RepID=UPI0013BC0392|nr:SDR family NAD(P)-dependent oxidoreductase [Streptomyces sp. SID13726]NEB00163.1 SDR family NAD(P)-dependent oxidoreductase [Streptomyces sp. SID13726]
MRVEKEQVAVVTGAASGIGYGLAEALAARGVRLVLSDIREDGLAEAAASLKAAGAEVVTVPADVRDQSSVTALADRTMTAYGRVDLVCNNAGVVSPAAPLWEQRADTWELMIGVKLLGVVHGVTAFAPLLIERGTGHFLNTASSGGLAPLPDRTPYTTTMHAVIGLTETLDVELKRVAPTLGATVLCPGLVDTPLGRNSAALGAIELPPGTPASMRDLAARNGGILTPRETAEAALTAIESGHLHAAPGTGVTERARARVNTLLNSLPAT